MMMVASTALILLIGVWGVFVSTAISAIDLGFEINEKGKSGNDEAKKRNGKKDDTEEIIIDSISDTDTRKRKKKERKMEKIRIRLL